MYRKRSSILAAKYIASFSSQVSSHLNSFSLSRNAHLNCTKTSPLSHHRLRRCFSVAAQRSDSWPESDANGPHQQNPSGPDGRSSLNSQQNSNGFSGETPAFQQKLDGFDGESSVSHQRQDFAQFGPPLNSDVGHQRGNLGVSGQWNSNGFYREGSNGHLSQTTNSSVHSGVPKFQKEGSTIGGHFNPMNNTSNVTTDLNARTEDSVQTNWSSNRNCARSSCGALQQNPEVVSDGNMAGDGYPYEGQIGFFRESQINWDRSHIGRNIEDFQQNSNVLSGGNKADDGYPYKNQNGFLLGNQTSQDSGRNHCRNPAEALHQNPQVHSTGARVGNENPYENQSGFFQQNQNLDMNHGNVHYSASPVLNGYQNVYPEQMYQKHPFSYGPQNSVESSSIGSPMLNNGLSSGSLLDVGEMFSYEGILNKLEELCEDQKIKEAISVLAVCEKVGMIIDLPRYLKLVEACGEAGSIEKARLVHDHLSRRLGQVEVLVHNKILDMYSKCGSIADAYQLFENMPQRNLMSWETMIRGLSDNGLGEAAMDLFTEFKENGLKPDGGLFAAIIYTCGVLGAVDQGMLYYQSMKVDFGILPVMEHYVSIVDMFGRNGYLDEALEFIEAMPIEPNVEVWETLSMFCRVSGYTELGDRCAEIVGQLDSSRVTEQSKMGLLPAKSLNTTKEKEKNQSSDLDVKRSQFEFTAGRPQNLAIAEGIRCLAQHMKEAGYIPDAALTLHDVDLESREEALLYHSERLAIIHGFNTSPARRSMKILKNLRVCRDCHNALKIISKLSGRLIVARDAKRFHHFENGVCSCNDFW